MLREAPNVVTEDGFRQLLAKGYVAVVLCRESAEKKYNSWAGLWVVHAVRPDGKDERLLVTARDYVKMREFKTIVGLASFLHDMGMRTANIPFHAGERTLHRLPEDTSNN